MKAFVEHANRKQREHAEIVESLHKERHMQTVAMRSRINQLEGAIALQSRTMQSTGDGRQPNTNRVRVLPWFARPTFIRST